jgi:hypothetical protein
MQVLFISLSFIGISTYFFRTGAISSATYTFIAYAVGLMAILTLILRWHFTRVKRNQRYWHKERFVKPKSAIKAGTGSSASNSTCSVTDDVTSKNTKPRSVPLVVL